MKDKRSDILDYPVSSFIVSKEGKQLTTKRVLFHVSERLEGYNTSSKKIIQSVLSPISVALCPTPQCVRQCKFCSNKQRNARNCMLKAEYNEEVFDQIMQDLNTLGVLGVTIAGGGEPLTYNKDIFFKFLAQANPPYQIGIHTNGVLLMNILGEEIIKAGNIRYINLSVVAHTPALYEKITGGSTKQFLAIENNLVTAVAMQDRYNNLPSLGIKILLCRENYEYVCQIKEYFESLGIPNVLLRCVGNFEPGQDIELLPFQNKKLIYILSNQLGLADDQIQAIIGKPKRKPPLPSRCWITALQYTAGIDPDGETYLCSPWSRKEYSIGNVNKQRFTDLWGSQRHCEVIETLNFKLRNNECNPLLCRHYYSNLAIDAFIQGFLEPLPKREIEEKYGRFI